MAHSSSGWLTLRVGVCLLLLFCFGNVVALGGEVEKGQNLIDIIVEFFRNIFSTFTGQAIVGVTPIPATGEWWNSSWRYRVGVEVDMGGLSRVNWPVEVLVDFRSELDSLGDSSALDLDSVRVIEYNSSGYVVSELKSDFEVVSGEEGYVVFILNGTTAGSDARDFLIYFDSVDNGKAIPGYSSLVSYNFDGSEFSVDNGLIDIRVDTSRGEGTSGIYYAERVDFSKVIFNVVAGERTAEYLRYYNGTNYFGADLDGDATLEFDGSVKKVVYQEGNEVNWGTVSPTGNEIWRRYVIYDGSPWIFMEHGFRNLGGVAVSRSSDGVGVPSYDVDRVFGLDNLIGPGGAGSDPWSWKSATKTVGAFGVGVINVLEVGTTNYYAQGSVFSGVIGIQLGATTINSGESISNKVAVYFNADSTHTGVSDLKDRLVTPVVLDLGSGEEYVVISNLSTEFDVYNLNESVLVLLNVLTDSHDLVRGVNVTFDMGTGSVVDDVVLKLFDDGLHDDGLAGDKVYGGRYTLSVLADVGNWNVSAKIYDKYFQEIGMDSFGFEVSDRLNGALNILNPTGLVGRNVFASFILENVRNDSGVSGVVSCDYNGTFVFDVLEVSLGNYSINFSAPGILGGYELNCLGSVSGNLGSGSDWFYVEPDKTVVDFGFSPLTKIVSDVTQSDGANFSVEVFVENIGGGFAPGVNVSLIMPSGDFVSNISFEECGSLSSGENCSKSFLVDVLSGGIPGDYNITINVSWINPDLSLNYSVQYLGVVVEANPIFSLSGFVFDEDVGEGENRSYGNFSVDSIGNDEVLDILFSCASGVVCSDFFVDFVPTNFSGLVLGASGDVEIFVGVPEGYSPGNYSGVVGVGSLNAGVRSFGINVSVGERGTWDVSRVGCDGVVLVEQGGDICEVVVNNSGNVELNFSVMPLGGNYTYVSPQNFSVAKQTNESFYVRYNTTGAPPNEAFVLNYIIGVLNGEPLSRMLNVSLLVVFGPEVWMTMDDEVEQGGSFLIRANISDRSFSGIEQVWANVTRPNGVVEKVNLSNVSVLGVGGYSSWEVNYSNTMDRGNYYLNVFARDYSGGMGFDNDSLVSFARLNVSLRTGWEDYLLGESGTIYYNVRDYSGTGLASDVNISVKDSDGLVRYMEMLRTNDLGHLSVLPSFNIPSDAVVGNYSLSSQTGYDDVISGKRISGFDNDSFSVYDHLFISLDTSVTWYPNSVMAFYLLVYSTGELNAPPTDVDLIVYDPAQNEYTIADLGDFDLVSNTSSSFLYLYKYAMPANSPTGDFLALVDVSQGTRSFQDVQAFRVSSGGPFDLILNLSVVDAVRGGVVPFEIIMKNMGEVPQDVYLDYWVMDASGNNYSRVTGEAIFVDAMGNTTISRTLPIFNWQSLGEHFLYVTMDYSTVIGPITTSKNFFVIDGNGTVLPEPGPSAGGGGGGASIAGEVVVIEEENLIILDIDPNELEIERGGVAYLMVEMKNNLDWDLAKVSGSLVVDGVEIGVSGVLDLLPMGEKVVLPIKISIPDDFDSGFYSGVVRVWSGSIESSMDYEVAVFDSKDELLAHRKSRLEDRLENLRTRAVIADNDDFDVGVIFDSIQRINLDFDLFDERLKARKYLESLEYLGRIENDIETVEYELDGIVSVEKMPWLVWVLIAGILILLILIIWVLWIRTKKVLGQMKFEKLRRKYVRDQKPEIKNQKPEIRNQKSEIGSHRRDYLKTLEEQYRYGYISKAAYDEAKEKL